jgi:hypothetical protein
MITILDKLAASALAGGRVMNNRSRVALVSLLALGLLVFFDRALDGQTVIVILAQRGGAATHQTSSTSAIKSRELSHDAQLYRDRFHRSAGRVGGWSVESAPFDAHAEKLR